MVLLFAEYLPISAISAIYTVLIMRFLSVATSELLYSSLRHPESASLPPLLRRESVLESQLVLAPPASPSSSIHSHLLHLYLHLRRLIPHLLKPCSTRRRPPSSHNYDAVDHDQHDEAPEDVRVRVQEELKD
jgi:hypothetical protein